MVLRYRFRLLLLAVAVIGGLGMLLARLWTLQVDQQEAYMDKIPDGRDLRIRVPGVRGEIRDRNGMPMVVNRANYEVFFDLKTIVDHYRETVSNELPRSTLRFANAVGIMEEKSLVNTAAIIDEIITPHLAVYGLARPFNERTVRMHYYSTEGVVPWTYRDDLSFEEFATFAEQNLSLPGVSVAARPVRRYVYGAVACHSLGYVRLPDDQRVPVEERREWDYWVGDDFGISGVEKSMDHHLRGIPGERIVRKDERGVITGEVGYTDPRPGADVYLTLDLRVQMIAEHALRDGGVGRGAVVVIDPWSGDVLASVSVPSYDPNKFIPKVDPDHWKAYDTDPSEPLRSRALGNNTPGSTYKVVTGLAGALAGNARSRVTCDGGQQYGNHFMKCLGRHGTIDLADAVRSSCNDFFYNFGNNAGINNLVTVGKLLGLGERSGIGIDGEMAGILPGPEWLRYHHPRERWSASYTAAASIGQGFVEATPLQMASVTATIASWGRSYRPRLVSRVVNTDGDHLVDSTPDLRADLLEEGIKREELEIVRHGMWKVVHDARGTARASQIKGFESAGKTGTATVTRGGEKDDNVWFIAFAPYEEPRYAIAVLVESGRWGGTVAAPVARRILEQSLALDSGFMPPMSPLAEAEGHFNKIQMISYGDDPVAEQLALLEQEERGEEVVEVGPPLESGEEISAGAEVVRAIPVAEPVIRAEPDSGEVRVVRATAPLRLPMYKSERRLEGNQ